MNDDLLKDQETLTLREVCEHCSLDQEAVVAYVQEGLVDVKGNNSGSWRFSEIHMIHIQKASRLERDLRLNPAGSVLVLELMNEIDRLKKQLKFLQRQDNKD